MNNVNRYTILYCKINVFSMYYLFIIGTLLFQCCFYFVDISVLYIQFNNIKLKRGNLI